jgi:hypothetical protein
MSLLNDALKRAKQTDDGGRPPVVPLQPVDYATRSSPFPRLILVLLAASALGLSVRFFRKWWQGEGQPEQTGPEFTNVVTRAQPSASGEPKPAAPAIMVSTNIVLRTNFVAAAERETSPVASPPTQDSALAERNASNTAAKPAPARSAAVMDDLRLFSIIYRPERPAAVINREMLFQGDEIGGARVIRIERNTVTLERGGTNLVLRLPSL